MLASQVYLIRLVPIILLVFNTITTTAQYTIQLTAHLPGAYTGDSIYVAGNFNGWNPAAEKYRLLPEGKNVSTVRFRVPTAGLIEFKLTRGSWSKTETTENGADIENRVIKIDSDTSLTLTINGWKDWFASTPRRSTASKNVRVADTAFYMPQLKTKRTIRVYLPPGYATGKERYPVLYMHDGQNLFDETLNPFGEWGVDEYLDSAQKKCIIIAIDNGANARMNEYNPYDNARFGKGLGKEYAAFLVNTLKPFADKRFRTKTGAANTFIAGSSMGGLISFYIALKYPKVFGSAAIISPAFWLNYKEVEEEIRKAKKRTGQKFFIYAGQLESDNLLQEVIGIFNLFNQEQTGNPVRLSIKALGKHNEQSWRKILPEFFEWLL